MTEKEIEYYEQLRNEASKFPETLFPGTIDHTVRVAANAGYLPAIVDMVRHFLGNDTSCAIHYARMGAELGDKSCQYYLGHFLYDSNVEEALKWLVMSAEQGSASAACLLGQKCQRGDGVPRDIEKAIEWNKRGVAEHFSYFEPTSRYYDFRRAVARLESQYGTDINKHKQ